MVTALPTDLAGIRDRALLTLGFESGLRRSELVALDFEHLKWIGSDVVVTVARSKTDQEARGRRVCVRRNDGAACAVRALDAWMSVADVKTSALFRQIRKGGHLTNLRLGDRAIERTVKYAADLAGMDSSRLSGHSLRSGFATAQARMGVPERTLMLRLGHSTPEMTRRYVRITEED
jgi:integrase